MSLKLRTTSNNKVEDLMTVAHVVPPSKRIQALLPDGHPPQSRLIDGMLTELMHALYSHQSPEPNALHDAEKEVGAKIELHHF